MNPFDVLRIEPTASPDEVRAAFRKRAFETHPDRGGDPEEFKRVNVAFEEISNPEAKKMAHAFATPRAAAANFIRETARKIHQKKYEDGGRRCAACNGFGSGMNDRGFMGRCGACGGRGWNPS